MESGWIVKGTIGHVAEPCTLMEYPTLLSIKALLMMRVRYRVRTCRHVCGARWVVTEVGVHGDVGIDEKSRFDDDNLYRCVIAPTEVFGSLVHGAMTRAHTTLAGCTFDTFVRPALTTLGVKGMSVLTESDLEIERSNLN